MESITGLFHRHMLLKHTDWPFKDSKCLTAPIDKRSLLFAYWRRCAWEVVLVVVVGEGVFLTLPPYLNTNTLYGFPCWVLSGGEWADKRRRGQWPHGGQPSTRPRAWGGAGQVPAVPCVGSCQLISSVTQTRAAKHLCPTQPCGAKCHSYYFYPASTWRKKTVQNFALSPVYLRVCRKSTSVVDITHGKEQNKVCAPEVAPRLIGSEIQIRGTLLYVTFRALALHHTWKKWGETPSAHMQPWGHLTSPWVAWPYDGGSCFRHVLLESRWSFSVLFFAVLRVVQLRDTV